MVEVDGLADIGRHARPRQEQSIVLLAEDNPAFAQVVKFNLERAGYGVIVAFSGREAWQAMQVESFDVLVTDQQMPEMTGCELCARMRTLAGHTQTPVILLTAKCLELDADRLKGEWGVAQVLGKPFGPRHLVETVGRVLNESQKSE
jgi:DNA-binding response OmpR family regulator